MILTDFLLARLAEEEEYARLHARPDSAQWLLADIRTKRHIISLALSLFGDLQDDPELAHDYGIWSPYEDDHTWAFGEVLRAFATFYTNHPDFEDKWRSSVGSTFTTAKETES